MKKFFKKLMACLWTPFNRDSLWNLCLNENYCTYAPSRVKNGMIFCHVLDETQEHRMDIKLALTVCEVIDEGKYLLKIPYVSPIGNHIVRISPIIVRTRNRSHSYVAGNVFTEYGQYIYNGTEVYKGVTYRYAEQFNDLNAHVFKEPFIDWGQCDR